MKRSISDFTVTQFWSFFLLAVASIVFSWWYFLYSPLLAHTQGASIETGLLKSQLERCAILRDECAELEKKCLESRDSCNSLIKKLRAHDPYGVICEILRLAGNAHLALVTHESSMVKSSENKLLATYVFKGSYDDIIAFFAALESASYFFSITSYTLTKISDEEISCEMKCEFTKIDPI